MLEVRVMRSDRVKWLRLRFTDERRYFVSEATVNRLLKAHDLITSPAYAVIAWPAKDFRQIPSEKPGHG